MGDEPVRSAEFNQAMKAQRDVIEALTERIAALESLNQASLMAKIAEADAAGEARGRQMARMEALEKRMDKASTTVTGLLVFLGGQFLWWVFSKINGR